ncbi:MAG: FAD-dependent oxidoreductase [Chlamydiota bacterium]
MRNKKIAVVGAGFAGMATAWHLSKDYEITIFSSPNEIQSASTVSAGLLHPYGGAKAKNNWRGKEGVQSTLKLLRVASEMIGQKVYDDSGIIRIPSNPEQEEYFKNCAEINSDVRWLSKHQCQDMVPGVVHKPAIFIESGITVYPARYIEGLILALESRGVTFVTSTISSVENIKGYDYTIFCIGAGVFQLNSLPELKLRPLKGQILQLPWPEDIEPLPYSLNSKIYMVMSEDKKSCYVGSTFERNFETEDVDLDTACTYILPKLYSLYPLLEGMKPIDCKSGIRVATPNHLPLVQQINEKVWIFTGLGSKGLLYHSLIAESIREEIAKIGMCNR